MSNLYKELKNNHSKEVNNFPMMFAFSQEQFNEGMDKLGLLPTETDKIFSIGMGGYIKKCDSKQLDEMTTRHETEFNDNIKNDLTGDNFIYDMFHYELCNHEYGYTYEIEDTLDSLDMTMESINSNPALIHGLYKATQDIKQEDN